MVNEPTGGQFALAERLRELRAGLRPGRAVPQRYIAEALGTSIALVSSWESLTSPVVPPEDRLKQYAHFLATERSIDGDRGRLLDDLSLDEESRRRKLIDELISLREQALGEGTAVGRSTGALGGRFWHFPDGQPIRIITTRLSRKALTSVSARTPDVASNEPTAHEPVPYASAWHPNFIATLWNGDGQATLELYGHIRAENPGSDVKVLTSDQVGRDDLTGHVVVLGQGESFNPFSTTPSVLDYMLKRLELPVRTFLPEGGDDEYDTVFAVTLDSEGMPTYPLPDGPLVTEEIHRPVFLRAAGAADRSRLLVEGFPQLEYDLAMLARKPNQLNLSATVTICSGIFSRGTYGAVRALTDPVLRTRNERWLSEHVDPDDFWILFQVPVFQNLDGAETVTPDLERPFHRLRMSDRPRAAQPPV